MRRRWRCRIGWHAWGRLVIAPREIYLECTACQARSVGCAVEGRHADADLPRTRVLRSCPARPVLWEDRDGPDERHRNLMGFDRAL